MLLTLGALTILGAQAEAQIRLTVRHALEAGATKQEIACRVIFVFSTADQKVVRKQRQKQIDAIRIGLEKTQKNVARRGPHSDEASVRRRVAKLLGSKDAATRFTWDRPISPVGNHWWMCCPEIRSSVRIEMAVSIMKEMLLVPIYMVFLTLLRSQAIGCNP